jgi:16S rRNA (guanine966-N2)-methyltransferase
MRVVAGVARGLRLDVPPGRDVRPTADRVREALFSSLGARVHGAVVLDLFGGSGALGIEALSRGASLAVIVEIDRRAADAIDGNLARTGLAGGARLIRGDALAVIPALAVERLAFDVAFLDPPYAGDLAARALAAVIERGLLAPGGVAVVEHQRRASVAAPAGLCVAAVKRYGDTALTYLSFAPKSCAPSSGDAMV